MAAETREALAEALAAIEVEYEPLPRPARHGGGAGGRARSWPTGRSAAARPAVALARRDLVVVEGTYHTPYQEHAYIEPNGMVAMPDGPGGMVVHGSMQCPFYVQKAVASALGCDLSQRAHRADRDRRRLRGQGGRAVRARRPGRPARPRHRPRRCASSSRAKRTWR